MITQQKTRLKIQSAGQYILVSLVDGQDEIALTHYENLKWVSHDSERDCNNNYFMVKKSKLRKILKSWLNHPFHFTRDVIRSYEQHVEYTPYLTFNHVDEDENVWKDYRPSIEKYFDKVN